MEKKYSILSDIYFFLRFYQKYEPVVLLCCAVEIVIGAFLPLLDIYLPKIAVDLVMEQAPASKAAAVLGGFALLMAVMYGIKQSVSEGKYFFYNNQRTHIMGLLFLKSLKIPCPDTEAGEKRQLYVKAVSSLTNGDWSASSRMVTGTVALVSSLLSFLLYSSVLFVLSKEILLLLLLLSFINYRISLSQIRYREKNKGEESDLWQKYYCVVNSMQNTDNAKEIHIFHMNPWLLALRDRALSAFLSFDRILFRKQSFYEKLRFFITMLRDMAAYVFLIYSAANGKVTVSEFVLYFGAITGFSNFVTGIMDGLADLRDAANGTDDIRNYLSLPDVDMDSGDRHTSELLLPLEIEFRDVCFSYKNSGGTDGEDKEIFRNFNLTIHAGEKIALVGVNGAGKTTFVKLLCGIYEPDAGQILLNGIDLKRFPKREVYALFSVVFQEHMILPVSIGENIAVDRADRVDEGRAWLALEKAGLKELLEEKKIGLNTYMTRQIKTSGIELSGGQKQRLFLARALYKDAPVMVLDEPTAALDPIAESEIYHSYNQYTKNKTAVFISHRLASTRFSDRIVMIEGGAIVEMGTHEELMEKNGAYAEMFQVQSRYYQEEA